MRNDIYCNFIEATLNKFKSHPSHFSLNTDPLQNLEKRGMKIGVMSHFDEELTRRMIGASSVKISAWSTRNIILGDQAEFAQVLAIMNNPLFGYTPRRDPRGIILVSSIPIGINKVFRAEMKKRFGVSCWTIWDLAASILLNPKTPAETPRSIFLQWQKEKLIKQYISDDFQPDYLTSSSA